MKIAEFLAEGMTFTPAVEINHGGRKIWSARPWSRQEEIKCQYCNGSGKETYAGEEHDCDMCNGKGSRILSISDAPELEVSTDNGEIIQEMLGIEPDSSGVIYHEDLPDVMRRLIMLKNKSAQDFVRPPSTSRGPTQKWTDENGITHIGRGAESRDFGLSKAQIDRYVDTLIKMVQFAQQNNAGISWS